MLDQLETLIALSETQTMCAAATRLRVTQSTVSKRIAWLEDTLGQPVVEPDGRKVRLTPYALGLLDRIRPLVSQLRAAISEDRGVEFGRLSFGVSESILASWGPTLLARARRDLPQLELAINAHRSPVVVDRVRSGEYLMGLCAAIARSDLELYQELLVEEPMVLVTSGLKPIKLEPKHSLPILGIELASATGQWLKGALQRYARESGLRFELRATVQSYAGIVQMARAGFGHALVPEGIVRALGLSEDALVSLPAPGLRRPISLIARPGTFARPLFKRFVEGLKREVTELELLRDIPRADMATEERSCACIP